MESGLLRERQQADLDANRQRPMDMDASANRKRPMDVDLKAGDRDGGCPCGRDSQAEACNGASRTGPVPPRAFSALVDNTVSVCTCRQTHDKPFCDGSHKLEF